MEMAGELFLELQGVIICFAVMQISNITLNDTVVDGLRDLVVLKLASSLGRKFDSPDIGTAITPQMSTDLPTFTERRLIRTSKCQRLTVHS